MECRLIALSCYRRIAVHLMTMEKVYSRGQMNPLQSLKHVGGHSRKNLRCFIICIFVLFLLLMTYFPVYHQVQVREAPITGWSVNTSRDMRMYILPDQFTAMIPQPEICNPSHLDGADPNGSLFLLVVVCSAVPNFEARVAIRETWGAAYSQSMNLTSLVRVVFLLGDPENITLQDQVQEESHKYGDIIQEGFVDTYYNLTLKSVMLLKWVSNHCPNARFVMKTDDDMFVNIVNLVRFLKSKTQQKGLLLGSLICGAQPISNSQNKWYAPRYMFSEHVYPNYLSGTGYVMSADVVNRLYKAALATPFFHLEDVYVTGMCAKRAGIRPRDHSGFTYQRRKLDACTYRSVITSHRLKTSDMYDIWRRMQSSKVKCPIRTRKEKTKIGAVRNSCV